MSDLGTCFSCGMKGVEVTAPPRARCVDIKLCDWRREMRRVTGHVPLIRTQVCIIELGYYGRPYYLQTFGAKSTDINFVIDPPRYYFQAVLERKEASEFKPWVAVPFARQFNGRIVDK